MYYILYQIVFEDYFGPRCDYHKETIGVFDERGRAERGMRVAEETFSHVNLKDGACVRFEIEPIKVNGVNIDLSWIENLDSGESYFTEAEDL